MIWAITQQSEVTTDFFAIDMKDVDAALRDTQRKMIDCNGCKTERKMFVLR